METKIKRISRELKYKGTILEIYQDIVEVGGKQVKWDFIHHKGAAAIIPVTKDGKILMVRQYRNAMDSYTLEIPAGGLDSEKEPRIECARRELEEETGYRSENLEHLITIHTTVAFCDELIEIFVAKDLVPSKQNLDEEEFIDVEVWELKDLEQLIYEGKITDAKTISALFAYRRKYADE